MDIFTVLLWVGTGIFLIYSLKKSKEKTKDALGVALGLGRGMIGNILVVIFFIGLILALLPPEQIVGFLAGQPLFISTIGCALFGTITIIPAFVAFPLVGTLVDAGIHAMPAVAFLTTLTMVGVATFSLEKKAFGLKFTVIRNSLSFILAILIAAVMGGIL